MPTYPSPYGPLTEVNSALNNIGKGLWSIGLGNIRAGMMGQHSAALEAQRAAQATANQAQARYFLAGAKDRELQAAGRTPEAIAEYGADMSDMAPAIYNAALNPSSTIANPEAGPAIPEGMVSKARGGRALGAMLRMSDNPNPELFMKAKAEADLNELGRKMFAGEITPDQMANYKRAILGKPSYDITGDTLYKPFEGGAMTSTPLGVAKIGTEGAQQKHLGAQTTTEGYKQKKLTAETGLEEAKTKNEKAGGGKEKFAEMNNDDVNLAAATFASKGGVEWKDINGPTKAAAMSRANELFSTPGSPHYKQAAKAAEAAFNEMFPSGEIPDRGWGAWRDVGIQKTVKPVSSPAPAPAPAPAKPAPKKYDPDKERRYQEWLKNKGLQ